MLPIQNLPPLSLNPPQTKASEMSEATTSFQDMLSGMVSNVHNQEQQADRAIQQLHAGGEKNLHEAMISMEQADIALRYMVQVRNKALEAYQEISRLQV
ncbi:flagellar hook-basal body complex protein FliE [Desulfogranum marinum]|jgi:flagellar hook-basal body complex protein FliE|uniref:flagellar hook-basal body complex protein FliE n=1 Tax=Desulfogranum marinum TaxID=453220 RepID=UPI001963FC74|nr:flagellar hook-basal body complex protein FliE [Desulfogranum marinum]MBM9513193.1 flagellar hook-basal body complex protein FliE [Desulfogranum marinum]